MSVIRSGKSCHLCEHDSSGFKAFDDYEEVDACGCHFGEPEMCDDWVAEQEAIKARDDGSRQDAAPRPYPVESARDGWHRIDCPWCQWYTSGLESVCDDAWHEHAAQRHPRRAKSVTG